MQKMTTNDNNAAYAATGTVNMVVLSAPTGTTFYESAKANAGTPAGDQSTCPSSCAARANFKDWTASGESYIICTVLPVFANDKSMACNGGADLSGVDADAKWDSTNKKPLDIVIKRINGRIVIKSDKL
jgi:hypothetical protein